MNKELLNNLASKASLKQEVYQKTLNSFKLLKEAAQSLAKEFDPE